LFSYYHFPGYKIQLRAVYLHEFIGPNRPLFVVKFVGCKIGRAMPLSWRKTKGEAVKQNYLCVHHHVRGCEPTTRKYPVEVRLILALYVCESEFFCAVIQHPLKRKRC
jgi:hypothetical protein